MKIRTETGSLYEFDFTNHTWARLEEGKDKSFAPLRTLGGKYKSVDIQLGERISILAEPLTEGAAFRWISTSVAVAVEG